MRCLAGKISAKQKIHWVTNEEREAIIAAA